MPGGSHTKSPSAAEETAWIVAAALAARTFRVPLRDVLDTRAGKQSKPSEAVAPARRAAIYLAAVGADLSNRGLQRATGLKGPTVRHHLHQVEDDRELKAQLDALLDELTMRLQLAMRALAEPVLMLVDQPVRRLGVAA